jgi:hypothetical protein
MGGNPADYPFDADGQANVKAAGVQTGQAENIALKRHLQS